MRRAWRLGGAALLAAVAACRGCSCETDPEAGKGPGEYRGRGPARIEVVRLELSGTTERRATVTVEGAPDLDAVDDRVWSAAIDAADLPAGFATQTGSAAVDVEIRAVDAEGRQAARRLRVRLSTE